MLKISHYLRTCPASFSPPQGAEHLLSALLPELPAGGVVGQQLQKLVI